MRALLYHFPLGEMDGTSVVLRRIYFPDASSVRHLYFRTGRFPVPKEFPSEFVKGEIKWRWRKGARFLQRTWRRLAFPLLVRNSDWVKDVSRASAHDGLTSMHVIVYDEITAEFAHRALEAAGSPPFALHLMDLLIDTPVNAHDTPHLCWLLERASALLTVSERLTDAVAAFTSAPTLLWPIPAGMLIRDRELPTVSASRPWQVLIGGAMYAGKAGFLEQVFLPAWKEFQKSYPNTELVYIGKDLDGVPETVRPYVRSLGVFPHDKVGDVLRQAAVAVLPVLHETSTPWRYSVPARISDYLAAGLPVIAPYSAGTGTHDFLCKVGAPATTLATRQDEVLARLKQLHDSPAHWLAASHAATAFASDHLELNKLRDQLLEFVSTKKNVARSAPSSELIPVRP